jgi:hypothetical protein
MHINMNNNYYKSPHKVVLTLIPGVTSLAFDISYLALSGHKAYYGDKLISYGQVMDR